jgi:hypothetical protein
MMTASWKHKTCREVAVKHDPTKDFKAYSSILFATSCANHLFPGPLGPFGRVSIKSRMAVGFGDRGSMENWAVERKKESNLHRNRLKCLRLGMSDRRLNGGVDNYLKNGNAGKRKTKSFMGIKRCRQEGAMRGSNAVDFKIPMDITTWPKHAG